MSYAWASRDRLCPMRMVSDHGYHDHLFELRRLEAACKSLRRNTRVPLLRPRMLRFERKRWQHSVAAGRLGEWPRSRFGRPIFIYRAAAHG